MSSNLLKLNADKTEFILLRIWQQLPKLSSQPLVVGDQHVAADQAARNHGMTLYDIDRNNVRGCFTSLGCFVVSSSHFLRRLIKHSRQHSLPIVWISAVPCSAAWHSQVSTGFISV
jgi:hypothetical protein